jgi:hypothetical protein
MSKKKTEIIRRLRLGNLRSLIRARCGHTLPDDDAGREYLWELLLTISLGAEADRKIKNAIEVTAPWMSRKEATEMSDQIKRHCLRSSTAREIGTRLRVTRNEWIKLKLKTILPFDMTDTEINAFRKSRRRTRDQHHRRAQGRKSHDASLAKAKPWKKEGMSRATWFRRKARKRERAAPKEHQTASVIREAK